MLLQENGNDFGTDNTYAIDNNEDAYELQINMDIADNEKSYIDFKQWKGDKYPISLNRADKSFIIDRTQSGEVSFSSEFEKYYIHLLTFLPMQYHWPCL